MNQSLVLFPGSKFTNNKAQYGGAAYFNKGFVTITDSVFENNIATAEEGGSCWLFSCKC